MIAATGCAASTMAGCPRPDGCPGPPHSGRLTHLLLNPAPPAQELALRVLGCATRMASDERDDINEGFSPFRMHPEAFADLRRQLVAVVLEDVPASDPESAP